MLMNNGPGEKPDSTTVMLTQVLADLFPAYSDGSLRRWKCDFTASRSYSNRGAQNESPG